MFSKSPKLTKTSWLAPTYARSTHVHFCEDCDFTGPGSGVLIFQDQEPNNVPRQVLCQLLQAPQKTVISQVLGPESWFFKTRSQTTCQDRFCANFCRPRKSWHRNCLGGPCTFQWGRIPCWGKEAWHDSPSNPRLSLHMKERQDDPQLLPLANFQAWTSSLMTNHSSDLKAGTIGVGHNIRSVRFKHKTIKLCVKQQKVWSECTLKKTQSWLHDDTDVFPKAHTCSDALQAISATWFSHIAHPLKKKLLAGTLSWLTPSSS